MGIQGGPIEILSDTMGVDFGPYMQNVQKSVKQNWYNLIPASARAPLMKKGKVTIEFAILRNGKIAGMKLVESTGDMSLDRAAWGGITTSGPFPPLPAEFSGPHVGLRFSFNYNPDPGDIKVQEIGSSSPASQGFPGSASLYALLYIREYSDLSDGSYGKRDYEWCAHVERRREKAAPDPPAAQ